MSVTYLITKDGVAHGIDDSKMCVLSSKLGICITWMSFAVSLAPSRSNLTQVVRYEDLHEMIYNL